MVNLEFMAFSLNVVCGMLIEVNFDADHWALTMNLSWQCYIQ